MPITSRRRSRTGADWCAREVAGAVELVAREALSGPRIGDRLGLLRRGALASEERGAYVATSRPAEAGSRHSTGAPPPPVPPPPLGTIEQSAPLGEMAEVIQTIDQLYARLCMMLVRALDQGLAEQHAQITLDLWLTQIGRFSRTERDRVLRIAQVVAGLPVTLGLLSEGTLSWSQVTRISDAAKRLRVGQRGSLDQLVGSVADEQRSWNPDDLLTMVDQHVDRLRPASLEQAERRAEAGEFLALSPQLFGGGSIYGEFGPAGFATISEALDAGLAPPTAAELDPATLDEDPYGRSPTEVARSRTRRHYGRLRAQRLLGWAEHDLAGHDRSDGGCRDGGARPSLLLTIDAASLLDGDAMPGWLLTTLSGGRLKVSSRYARELLDERGCDLRLIAIESCGEVVGVGRRTRVPPDWLRDAVIARDLADRSYAPSTAARICDIDHIVGWNEGGRTDVDNLHPIGRRAHGTKTDGHWHAARARDGTTTWRHTRSDLTVTRPPARRRLANRRPDSPRRQ